MKPGEQQALQRLGDNIRFERTIRRLSQESVAFTAGIHRTQITLIETGQRSLRVLTFVRLCGALGLSADELLKGIAWQPGSYGEGHFLTPGDESWKR